MKPFHLSFAVPDLKQARQFYQDTLGCAVGRDEGSWIDVILFGHQITIHKESEHMKSRPIDHFGPILDKSEWENVRERCESAGVEFSMRPLILADGTAQESGKFTIKDPADNVIEFKYYGDGKEPNRSEGGHNSGRLDRVETGRQRQRLYDAIRTYPCASAVAGCRV